MSEPSNLLLLGLRESGKTSYIAALWHLVESGDLQTVLKCAKLQPNRAYLNKIRESWLRFEQVGRTSLRNPQTVELHLEKASSGMQVNVVIPDMSGELFRLQWVTRKATIEYARLADQSTGILLFVHPDTLRRSERIVSSLETNSESASGLIQLTEELRPWSHNTSPTQVQLVELMQFVRHLRKESKNYVAAVIISAWDLVKDDISPKSWLDANMPLLAQYLRSNEGEVPYNIYGVSALGGDLDKDVIRLKRESVPSRRINVVAENLGRSNDLTIPISTLLEASKRHNG